MKLYLFSGNPVLALQQIQKYIKAAKKLPEFVPNPNGIIDYNAFISNQYVIFAELIQLGVEKASLKLPFPPPGSLPSSNTASGQAQTFLNAISNTGLNVITGSDVPVSVFGPFSATNTSRVVQHPGVYYYLASKARDAQRKLLIEAQVTSKTDLATSVIELLTKAYEQFRDAKGIRMTLFLASEIARVYSESGKYDMALRFFQKIARTYRKEN